MNSRSDEELMLAYAGGEADAFEALYERHRGGLYRYLLRQCGNEATTAELFQDVWMNLIRARRSYQVRAKFTTYLYHLAHNRLIDHYRKQARGIPISYTDDDCPVERLADTAAYANPERQVELQRQAQRLNALIDALPEAQREAFVLREEGGLSLDEIAEATGVGRETAKSRLRYAVNRLRQELAGLDDA